MYRWHKDFVFVEQREVEEKDEDYMFVSDDGDEESSSDEDEEKCHIERRKCQVEKEHAKLKKSMPT